MKSGDSFPELALIGEKIRDKVTAYGTGRDVGWFVQNGFKAVKLPMPFGPLHGEAGKKSYERFFTKVRDLIGSETRLFTDCLMGWSVPYTISPSRLWLWPPFLRPSSPVLRARPCWMCWVKTTYALHGPKGFASGW